MYSVHPYRGGFGVLVCSLSPWTDERNFGNGIVVFFAECGGECGDNYSGCRWWRVRDSGGVGALALVGFTDLGSHYCSGVDAGVGGVGEDDVCDFVCRLAGGLGDSMLEGQEQCEHSPRMIGQYWRVPRRRHEEHWKVAGDWGDGDLCDESGLSV